MAEDNNTNQAAGAQAEDKPQLKFSLAAHLCQGYLV